MARRPEQFRGRRRPGRRRLSIRKAEFVERSGSSILRVFCKLCGDAIAGMTEKPAGSGPLINQTVLRFKRFSNYAEVKFECDDGSYHVTNGCKNCLTMLDRPEDMTKLLLADAAEQGRIEARSVVSLAAIDLTGSGLV